MTTGLKPRSIYVVSMPTMSARHALHGGWGADFRRPPRLSTWIHSRACSLMKSAIMMFHLRFPGARSILHRAESHLGPHPPIYARTSIELCLYVPDKGLLHQPGLPWSKGVVSPIYRFALLANKVYKPGSYQNLPVFLPNGTPHICPYQIQLRGGAPDLGVPGAEGR